LQKRGIVSAAQQPEHVVKGKGRLKREATEAALIEAFGRVVQRSGLRTVGVNEVIKEAGIGKALLYRYFGGLPGLVRAWGEARNIWPDLSEFHALPDDPAKIDARALLKRMVLHHANSLREDPLRVEILAEQFMNPSPISEALQEIRQQLGREHQQIFLDHSVIQEHSDLMRFLMGAVSFLAMRAVKAPWYMGENIGTDEGWAKLMGELEKIVDAVVDVP
jgi:AcrR family transcriptional regulator